MKQRVISGAVLVVILAVTLYFGGAVTCVFMGLVSLIGNMELLRVYGVNRKLPGIVCYLATIFYYVAIYLQRMDIIIPMMVIYLLIMLAVYVLTFPTYSDKHGIVYGFLLCECHVVICVSDKRYEAWTCSGAPHICQFMDK